MGTGDNSDLINYKAALRLISMNADAADPSLKLWSLKPAGFSGALSMADSVSLASSVFPQHAKNARSGESRVQQLNTNYQMKMINRTLDAKIKPPRTVKELEHGLESGAPSVHHASTGRDFAPEPVTENPYGTLTPTRNVGEALEPSSAKEKRESLSLQKAQNPNFAL